jgi:uncharacterized protein (TIGR03546 family)
MIGFVPGLAQGGGLLFALALLLILLNANLGVAALVGAGAKLVALALTPVSFMVGRALLDGPTQPLFAWAINAPVLALFGLDYYVTTGGAAIGLVLGLGVGFGLVAVVKGFRRKMASLEENSEAYKRYAGKWWVRVLAFLFIGGGPGKVSYSQMLDKRIGNPVRPLGLALVVLVVALLWIVQAFASGPILTAALVSGLEQANGATVDLSNADMDLKGGRLTITGLAMADPNNLATDIFRAASLEADISGADLLRRRVGMDTVVVKEASSGAQRTVPGRLIGPPPEPAPAPTGEGDEKTIDDYIKQAKEWKERLAQVRKWLEEMSGGEAPAGTPEEQRETLRERLEREVREKGYRNVRAEHLIEGAPTFLIRDFVAEGVTAAQLEGEVLDIHGTNLSTQPQLVEGTAKIEVRSRSGRLEADVALGTGAAAGSETGLHFAYTGLSADMIGSALAVAGQAPMQGGTVDVELTGKWDKGRVGYIHMPLDVTLRDTTLSVPGVAGAGSAKVKEFTLPIGLRGPIDNPRIMVDDKRLADALVQAGAGQLVEKGKQEAEKAIDKAAGDALGKLGGSGGLGGLLGGGDKDKKKSDEK